MEYGSRDGGFLAHECPRGSLHLHTDRVIVEIVRGEAPVGAGEIGEIVLTLLDAMGMPLLRFRTGDAGALDDRPCPCGLPFPVLRSLEGRCSDYLMGRDGRLIHSEALSDILEAEGGVSRYRALQESLDCLTMEVIPAPGQTPPLERIRARVRALLGEPLEVQVKLVDSIAPTASGKHRFVVSKLTGRYFDPGA
jgi:phenylacetate-CoA ligase